MNKGARSRIYKSNEYNEIVGLCSGNPDPELWFSDSFDDSAKQGRPSGKQVKGKMIARTLVALSICSICPVKEACLAEGLKQQNIDFGIWGGTLPAERIAMTTRSKKSTEYLKRRNFARQVREAERLLLNGQP